MRGDEDHKVLISTFSLLANCPVSGGRRIREANGGTRTVDEGEQNDSPRG
jgi:hypothetical protein